MNIYEYYMNLSMGLNKAQIEDLARVFRATIPLDVNVWKDNEVTAEQTIDLAKKAQRIANNEPLAYVLGDADFFWCKIAVTPKVLIPRPETEELCEMISNEVNLDSCRMLDLCTGSGCIAIGLAKNKPGWQVVGADISADSIALARQNALQNGVNVDFVESDMWQNVEGEFDVIVSNPPYIPTGELLSLPVSVRDYEPHLALDGGVDGLNFYREIAARAPRFLREGGYLYLEVGDNAGAVAELLQKDFIDVQIRKDLFGKERFVLARKK